MFSDKDEEDGDDYDESSSDEQKEAFGESADDLQGEAAAAKSRAKIIPEGANAEPEPEDQFAEEPLSPTDESRAPSLVRLKRRTRSSRGTWELGCIVSEFADATDTFPTVLDICFETTRHINHPQLSLGTQIAMDMYSMELSRDLLEAVPLSEGRTLQTSNFERFVFPCVWRCASFFGICYRF